MQGTLEESLTSEHINLMEKGLVEVKPQYTYMNWFRFREEFRMFIAEEDPFEKPDILYIRATEKLPPPGMEIEHIIRCLKKDCIVITNAMSIRDPVAPLAFPGDSVIAVGRKGEKVHGPTLDFVISNINSSDTSNKVEDKDCKDTAVEAEKKSLLVQKSDKEQLEITIEEPQQSGSIKNKDDQAKKVKDKKGKGAGKGKKGKGAEENVPLMMKNKYPSASSEVKDDEAEIDKKPSDQAEKIIPWEASLEAVGIAAVILLKAQHLRK